jgi:hypothetical protein
MRLAACFLVSAALLLVSTVGEPVKAQPPDGGKKGGGKGFDPSKIFELLAKGKDTLDIADVRGTVRPELEAFAKANKLDPAKMGWRRETPRRGRAEVSWPGRDRRRPAQTTCRRLGRDPARRRVER